ncbi:unnamed protein product [Durusdinium trenchii]|uniref:Uncharacterized protein n=1 Tax=Durusdinium trenchii TaxID=1381693 RepID=A0ABP0JJQ2_9DINO
MALHVLLRPAASVAGVEPPQHPVLRSTLGALPKSLRCRGFAKLRGRRRSSDCRQLYLQHSPERLRAWRPATDGAALLEADGFDVGNTTAVSYTTTISALQWSEALYLFHTMLQQPAQQPD